MNTALWQPPYLEECKRIGHKEKDDCGSHTYKKGVSELVRTSRDKCGKFKIWKVKDELKNICQCKRYNAENSL